MATLMVAGGVSWWVLAADDEQTSTPPNASPTRSPSKTQVRPLTLDRGTTVLSEPRASWSMTPSDFGASAFGGFDEVGNSPVATLGDQVIVRPDDAYVALDASTGKKRWQYNPRANGAGEWSYCDVLTTVLACRSDEGLALVDGEQGTVLATKEGSPSYGAFHEVTGGILWVYGEPDSPTLELLSLRDLSAQWTVHLQDPDPTSEPFESEISAAFRINGAVATVMFGRATWDVSLASGRELSSHEDDSREGVWVHRQGALMVETAFASDYESSYTVVRDLDGSPLVAASGSAWFDNGSAPPGLVGIGGALYDTSTGSKLWDHTDDYGNHAEWLPAGRFVSMHGDGTTSYFQTRTGEFVTSMSDVLATHATRDGILTIDESGQLMVHGSDGDLAWQRTVPMPEYSVQQIAVAGNAVVAGTDSSIVAFTGFTSRAASGGSGDDEGTDFWTDCGSEPVFTPREVISAHGGVQIEYEVTATCPGGQWLNWTDYRVSWQSSSGETLATGSFDFSQEPRWVPEDGRRLSLVYPFEGANADLDELERLVREWSESEDSGDGAETGQHVLCTPEESAGRGQVPAVPDEAEDDEQLPLAGTTPVEPTTGEPQGDGLTDEAALAALKRIAAADAPVLDSDAEGRWVPQLSSKVYGTVDDGISYTYRDILAEHLRLRARYPDVRLAFSGEWGSFSGKEFWVTVSVSTSAEPEPALTFCSDHRFIPGHCYAKRLVREGTPEGNTRHLVDQQ